MDSLGNNFTVTFCFWVSLANRSLFQTGLIVWLLVFLSFLLLWCVQCYHNQNKTHVLLNHNYPWTVLKWDSTKGEVWVLMCNFIFKEPGTSYPPIQFKNSTSQKTTVCNNHYLLVLLIPVPMCMSATENGPDFWPWVILAFWQPVDIPKTLLEHSLISNRPLWWQQMCLIVHLWSTTYPSPNSI